MWYYGIDGGAEQQGRSNNLWEGENMLGIKKLWYIEHQSLMGSYATFPFYLEIEVLRKFDVKLPRY
jgi:hypothetical protein